VSAPQHMHSGGPVVAATSGLNTGSFYMPDLAEGTASPSSAAARDNAIPLAPTIPHDSPVWSWLPLRRTKTNINGRSLEELQGEQRRNEYQSDLVDFLDILDPEVATLSTLTNVQNSLFVPDLGRYLNRRPIYNLTSGPANTQESETSSSEEGGQTRPTTHRIKTGATLNTISSRVNDDYYAVLPHGATLFGWSKEDKSELDDHVRHMLHSRRSKFKRRMKGFTQYIKKPLGFFVTLYATLITLFGLAWVLFLIGWINVGGRKDYIVNIIDNVLVGLFAIMGDGLAPFRAVDTYHMCFIAHYHHLTWRLRKEQSLPKLQDHNDLPAVLPEADEAQKEEVAELSVLSSEQQIKLAHHQKRFSNSHSFYKPHETTTHHAFPLRLLVAVVVLLDCHSFLQIALGTCTWAISYHIRPFALTTVILCCSITCNIAAGVLIIIGDHKTRKKDVIEKVFRQELTADAIQKLEKRKGKEEQRNQDLDTIVEPEDEHSAAKEPPAIEQPNDRPTFDTNSRESLAADALGNTAIEH